MTKDGEWRVKQSEFNGFVKAKLEGIDERFERMEVSIHKKLDGFFDYMKNHMDHEEKEFGEIKKGFFHEIALVRKSVEKNEKNISSHEKEISRIKIVAMTAAGIFGAIFKFGWDLVSKLWK